MRERNVLGWRHLANKQLLALEGGVSGSRATESKTKAGENNPRNATDENAQKYLAHSYRWRCDKDRERRAGEGETEKR